MPGEAWERLVAIGKMPVLRRSKGKILMHRHWHCQTGRDLTRRPSFRLTEKPAHCYNLPS